jgi:hypothetical protein
MEEHFMKKTVLYTILVLAFVLLAGCKRKDIKLNTKNAEANTVVIKKDGTVQAATVEEFNKEYYSLNELNNFITKKIDKFNKFLGSETAIAMDSLEKKGESAVLIITYQNLDTYAAFNKVEAVMVGVDGLSGSKIELPDVFVKEDNGSYVKQEEALKNEKYKVVMIKDNVDLKVEGTIKYYANCILVNSYTIQTAPEDASVIVYKP